MNQKIHFITGKGGVGKSACAAAFAMKLGHSGKNVLLVELGEQSFYRDFFLLPQVGFEAVQVRPNLSVALWSGDSCLREYAKYLIKVESLTKLFFDNAVMRAFINIAPGLSELAILGKITSWLRNDGPPLDYDCIVVDAFSTGHFKALLGAPKGLSEAIQFGPMGEQSRSIDRYIRDKNFCHYHIVTLPEELPIKEAVELKQQLKSEYDVDAELILNKLLNVPIEANELARVAADENNDLNEFASYLLHQLERQRELLKVVKGQVGNLENIKQVPLIFETDAWKLIELMAGNI